MLDVILIIISALCMIAGLAGCVLPFLPGPPIAYLGLVFLHFTDKVHYTPTQLIIWLLIVAVVQVLDYFTPMLGSKYSGGSKWGNWGCIIGTLVGLLFLPWGVILGPFLGAVIGELLGNKEFSQALKIRSRLINRIYTGHLVEVCCLRLLLLSVYPRIYQVILIEKTVFLYAKRFFFYIKYAVSNEKDLTNAFLCCIFVEVTCNKTIN